VLYLLKGRFFRGGMNTIDWADINAGGVFTANAGLCNNVGHDVPFLSLLTASVKPVVCRHSNKIRDGPLLGAELVPSDIVLEKDILYGGVPRLSTQEYSLLFK
jgi:hypothetical protein